MTSLRLVLLLVPLLGCAARAPVDLTPRTASSPRYVVGRLLVYRDGRPVGLTASGSPLSSTLEPIGPLTALVASNLDSRQRFRIPITDERGWFAATLPPGAYALGVDHYIWAFDTPARFQVPAGDGRCYLGTLGVNLFAAPATADASTRRSGGPVAVSESAFQLLDQPAAAYRFAGRALAACPIRLLSDERRAMRNE